MSANMDEAIERQRALHYLLISVSRGHDALLRELYDRYYEDHTEK